MAKCFGWDAVKLSDLTFGELEALRQTVISDPRNANPDHTNGRSIYLYTTAARRKLDALSWAVTYKLNDKRRAA